MIGSLRGTVLELSPSGFDRAGHSRAGELLLEVGGVGYRVSVPASVLSGAELAGLLFVHVSTQVREDAIVLYGFGSRDERAMFELLVSVHGVGPALALALLSTHPPAALRRIVASHATEELMLVPGVGRKTATRLLLELEARLVVDDGVAVLDASGAALVGGGDGSGIARAEVRSALAGLGYGTDEVADALRELPDEGEVPELLRQALRRLAGAR